MKSLLHPVSTYLYNKAPVAVARTRRFVQNGPSFKKEGTLWRIEDESGVIHVPFIRRYGMYVQSVGKRIEYMLERYQLGDFTDALVIDIGAHVGEFAMAAAPRARKVMCFEPDPQARAALVQNTQSHPNVQILPIALSNESKKTPFYVATAQADSSLFRPEKYSQVINVDARRLDSLNIDTAGYSRVVLKMDAEGFEPEVLQGAGRWLEHLDAASVDVAPERAGEDTYAEVKLLLEQAGLIERALTDAQVLVTRRA